MPPDLRYTFNGSFTTRKPEPLEQPEKPPALPVTPPVAPAVLSPEELATYLGCSRTYAYRILQDGSVPSFKVGRRRKVLRSDADAYLTQLRDSAGGAR